ncbi:hypothetical protein [Novosphingobium olei]|uniref:BolA family transcriptional regulator n=1 Tax=Novosphingobium olei TaxID=2728851 RepID=A0A7Y0GBF9_9SPHN|nr:hypothetical protein [Novosphingobium olei]NML96080.1 hypothetical protein [Novosphingobium olei]
MKTEVASAIAELERAFPDARVETTEDGQGGAYFLLEGIDLIPRRAESDSRRGFLSG